MSAAILQLHTRKNQRLTLGPTRVTKDRNNGDAANATYRDPIVVTKNSSCFDVSPHRHDNSPLTQNFFIRNTTKPTNPFFVPTPDANV
jgi:hypothetical protein